MLNLSRNTLRGLAGAAAATALAAFALPNAQAVPAANPPYPVLPQPAETPNQVAGNPPAGEGLTTMASSPTTIVRYNRLYSTPAITPSKCREVNVSLRTQAGVASYASQLWTCMYAAWAVPLKAAGAAYKVKPKLSVHSGTLIATDCGTVSNTTGYYCSGRGGVIYVPAAQIIKTWGQNPTYARAWLTQMMSHEYGHHVQFLTGILNASWTRQRAFTTNAARLEESRRRELQASCLGAAYVGANKRYYPMAGGLLTQYNYLISHMGDQPGGVRDHGSPKNHAFWSTAGFNARHTYTVAGNCNTFNASSTYVA
ncbi:MULTISPECIES: neutral zinc metallopeptidase [unclassified Kribbella]|uniref:neutral zinc metallopeptidase n=1 Tax=unclassified Kribbella TaxID=2644121 RepID=UPI0033CB3A03